MFCNSKSDSTFYSAAFKQKSRMLPPDEQLNMPCHIYLHFFFPFHFVLLYATNQLTWLLSITIFQFSTLLFKARNIDDVFVRTLWMQTCGWCSGNAQNQIDGRISDFISDNIKFLPIWRYMFFFLKQYETLSIAYSCNFVFYWEWHLLLFWQLWMKCYI